MINEHEFVRPDDGPAPARRRVGSAAVVRHIWHDDILWTVSERPHGEGDTPATRLIFDNGATVRTVRRFPADWAALPDDELFALCVTW